MLLVMRPIRTPIGLQLSQAARIVGRAFDDALAQAGGSLPVWLILLNLKIRKPENQRELAEAVGVREATLTHHLNAMDTRGLITRERDAANRRIHIVSLTEDGEALFLRLQQAAMGFNTQLCDGLSGTDLDTLGALLAQLTANAGGAEEGAMPWAGGIADLSHNGLGASPSTTSGRIGRRRAYAVPRVSRPGGRDGPRGPPRKVRAPQGKVVGNADPG
jgi:MarR family transcriptional regulator, transcriptional regulator for hemolysin